MRSLIDAADRIRAAGEPAVLASIIETQGSTYRKAGARMLITADGQYHGLLGGGCFEGDLLEHARKVLSHGAPKTLLYDMRAPDDTIWGLGLGCNGAVRVLLQRLDAGADYAPLEFLRCCHDTRENGVLITLCEAEAPFSPVGASYGWTPASGFNPDPGDLLRESLTTLSRRTLSTGRPALVRLHHGASSARAFVAPVPRPVQLLLLGGGADAYPFVALATRFGWEVTVADHRDSHARSEHFPDARRVIEVDRRSPLADIDPDEIGATVVMSHNLAVDRDYLEALAATSIPYVGLLGPRARREQLLEALGDAGAALAGRLYGPAGLDIGGEQPESIALSVLAEAHAVMHERSGGHLIERQAPLHDR